MTVCINCFYSLLLRFLCVRFFMFLLIFVGTKAFYFHRHAAMLFCFVCLREKESAKRSYMAQQALGCIKLRKYEFTHTHSFYLRSFCLVENFYLLFSLLLLMVAVVSCMQRRAISVNSHNKTTEPMNRARIPCKHIPVHQQWGKKAIHV